MKRILRIGKGYALTKHQLKYLNIRYLSLLAVVMSMCLYAVKQVSAQQAEPAATAVADIKPLQIGDTIPEWLWHHPLQVVNHPDGKDTITLNDYRGKLIMLDFWATWCSPCITAAPRAARVAVRATSCSHGCLQQLWREYLQRHPDGYRYTPDSNKDEQPFARMQMAIEIFK